MKHRIIVCAALLLPPISAFGQIDAVTEDGRAVVLKTDGTWSYADGTESGTPQFQQMSPEEFHATHPTKPVTFRALVKLDDYYNYDFSGKENVMWSVQVHTYDEKSLGNGYVKKESKLGRFLFAKLRDGKWHKAVVDLRYLPNQEDSGGFLISNLRSFDAWDSPRM